MVSLLEDDDSDDIIDPNASTVVQLINKIIIDAYKLDCSDIHIEPSKGNKPATVRFRVDGLCREVLHIPAKHIRSSVARIKVMANLDITENRKPQDGKIAVTMKGKPLELRVATLPTINGESVIMRILAAGDNALPFEKLGYSERISTSSWPEFSKDNLDASAIQSEELLKSTIDDVANILKVTKMTPQKITIYTADSFKSKIYYSILEKVMTGQTNMGIVMKELIANPETADVKKIPDFVQKTIKDILSEPTEIRETKLQSKEFDEKNFLSSELADMGKKEFGVKIGVFSESDEDIYDPKGKARHARPFKPAILIE